MLAHHIVGPFRKQDILSAGSSYILSCGQIRNFFFLIFFFFSVTHFILLSFTCMCHHIMAVYLMVKRTSGRGNAG